MLIHGYDAKDVVEIRPTKFEKGEVGGLISYWKSDINGSRITPIYIHKSESFLLQFLRLLYMAMNGSIISPAGAATYEYPIVDTNGVERFVANCWRNMTTAGAIGDTTLGIVAGTDNTAPTFTDNALGAKIAHGTGAGQLQYGATGWGLPSATAAEAHFRISRVLSNASGGLIHVDEVGIECAFLHWALKTDRTQPSITDAIYRALIIRDLLGVGGEDILNGQNLTINYDIKAVV